MMQKSMKKRFPIVLLTCILGIVLCAAGALVSTRKVFADAATTDFTLADYKMFDVSGGAVTDEPVMDRKGIDFEGADNYWNDGIVYKTELTGAYSIEFDLMTDVEYGGALVTLGHKNLEVIGGGDQIQGTDSVSFAINVSGIISGFETEVTASGYTITPDAIWGDELGSFSGNKTFRFKFDVDADGNIDAYVANLTAAPGVATAIDFKRFYTLTKPATGGGNLTDGYFAVFAGTAAGNRLMMSNVFVNAEKAADFEDDSAWKILGDNHKMVEIGELGATAWGTTVNYRPSKLLYDGDKIVSDFYLDGDNINALNDGDVIFDATFSIQVNGDHGGAWPAGGQCNTTFWFGLENKTATAGGKVVAGYDAIYVYDKSGTLLGHTPVTAYMYNGTCANLRIVAKKGGQLDVYYIAYGGAFPKTPNATYTGFDFAGYTSVEVTDGVTTGTHGSIMLHNFVVKANPSVAMLAPESVSIDNVKMHIGDTKEIEPKTEPSTATKKFTYTSDNTDIVTVSGNTLTAVAAGTATITAVSDLDNSVTTTFTVTVTKPVESVAFATAPKASLNVGETETLSVNVAPADATDKSVEYTSSDATVATVDANGTVTAVGKGTATITATAVDGTDAAKVSYTLTVIKPVESVAFQETSVSVLEGSTIDLTAVVTPADASDVSVTFSSSAPAIASVDANGTVTGVAKGDATITVTTTDGNKTATCSVRVVKAATAISLDKTAATVEVGETTTINATLTPSDSNDVIVWTSSNGAVATVENGVVTAVGKGTATITATAKHGEVSATCEITAIRTLKGVVLNKSTATVAVGDKLTLVAALDPADIDDVTVTFESSDTSIATVSATGDVCTVSTLKAGEVTITVKAGAFSATCKITVKDIALTLKSDSETLDIGGTYKIEATLSPDELTNKTITYESSDESVVTVAADGTVTAVAAGEATITVKGGGKEVTFTVTVNAPAPPKKGCKNAAASATTAGACAAVLMTAAAMVMVKRGKSKKASK